MLCGLNLGYLSRLELLLQITYAGLSFLSSLCGPLCICMAFPSELPRSGFISTSAAGCCVGLGKLSARCNCWHREAPSVRTQVVLQQSAGRVQRDAGLWEACLFWLHCSNGIRCRAR